jgi:hypothetical protein
MIAINAKVQQTMPQPLGTKVTQPHASSSTQRPWRSAKMKNVFEDLEQIDKSPN